MKPILAGFVLAMAALTPAFGQTVHGIEARQQAVVAAWQQTPLSVRRAMLVAVEAPLFGDYDARPTDKFQSGEPIIEYVEPVGYTWKPAEDGKVQFGVVVDLVVKTPGGKILGGKEHFIRYKAVSHARVQELMLNMTVHLNGLPPGDYILTFVIHDINDLTRTSSVDQPITIAA
jgi:hypothetical protein